MNTPPKLAGLRLLVVEDNRDVAEMTAIALEGFGAAVRCAFTGAEALAAARQQAVDVAILDLGLPDMAGVDLATALREAHAASRIIALTGFEDAGGDPDGVFDVFLQKPISASVLARVISEARSEAP